MDYEDFEVGVGNYAAAIIEREDGVVEVVPADMIQFIEGEGTSDDNSFDRLEKHMNTVNSIISSGDILFRDYEGMLCHFIERWVNVIEKETEKEAKKANDIAGKLLKQEGIK